MDVALDERANAARSRRIQRRFEYCGNDCALRNGERRIGEATGPDTGRPGTVLIFGANR